MTILIPAKLESARQSEMMATDFPSPLGEVTLIVPRDYPADWNKRIKTLVASWGKELIRSYGVIDPRPYQIILVKTHRGLKNWHDTELAPWVYGLASEIPSRILLICEREPGVVPQFPDLWENLAHELVHIYIQRIAPGKGTGWYPAWFNEGLALLTTQPIRQWRPSLWILEDARGNYRRLNELRIIKHIRPSYSAQAYAQSVLAVWLMEKWYGDMAISNLLESVRRGARFEDAFYSSTGDNLDRFELKYRLELIRRFGSKSIFTHPYFRYLYLPLLILSVYLIAVLR